MIYVTTCKFYKLNWFKRRFLTTWTILNVAGFLDKSRSVALGTALSCWYFFRSSISSDSTTASLGTFADFPILPFAVSYWKHNIFGNARHTTILLQYVTNNDNILTVPGHSLILQVLISSWVPVQSFPPLDAAANTVRVRFCSPLPQGAEQLLQLPKSLHLQLTANTIILGWTKLIGIIQIK